MEKYTFNPDYKLYNDDGRVMLMSGNKYFPPLWGGVSDFESFIHPIYAIILSFFNGVELQKGIIDASKYLGIESVMIEDFVNRLIQNQNTVVSKYKEIRMFFPPNTIVKHNNSMGVLNISYSDFDSDGIIDLRPKRHSQPRDLSLYLTSTCYTDCIYCLADRENKKHTSLLKPERICELIEEAKKLNVNSFEITGGEVFLYPHWDIVVEKLVNSGFPPYISTKVPVGEKIVKKLVACGVKEVQVSLDSLINKNLIDLVRPQNSNLYLEKMKESILLLGKYGIKVCIHTIVTSLNDSIADMESIFNFIKPLNNISSWRIDEAFYSRYSKENWGKIRTSFQKMQNIYNFTEKIKGMVNVDIDDEYDYNKIQFEKKEDFLKKGVRCPANYSSIGILSDGKVTSCNRFFWEPQFIIGDITNMSITEVWNSKEALALWNKKRNKTSKQQSSSKCYSCEHLDLCIDASRVCWSEIVDINGVDKWDYPDLQCPDSEEVKNREFVLRNE